MTDIPPVIVDSLAHLPLDYIRDPEALSKRLTLVGSRGIGDQEERFDLELFDIDRDRKTFSIPREYFFSHLLPYGWEWEDRTVRHPLDEKMKFRGDLDPDRDQIAAVEKIMGSFDDGKLGGILKAPPGTGKTVMGLYVAAKMGCRTLVLVYSDFLLDQWEERIQQFLGVEPGIIQRDCWEIDKPICIAMIQTLMSRGAPDSFRNAFGLVLVDEGHRYGAARWHEVIKLLNASFRLGLTATPYRKDGLERVFLWHIGEILYELDPELLKPRVYQVATGAVLPAWIRKKRQKMRSKMITMLAENDARTDVIEAEVRQAIEDGRKTIVFSERKSLLFELSERLGNGVDGKSGLYIGGMDSESRNKSAEKPVVLATYQFCREALDIPELDAVFLATPISDIEQAVGRILRPLPDKKQPVVVDFVDETIPYLKGVARHRVRQYRNLDYDVRVTIS